MRTYSFDHFKADKPEPSTTNPGGAEQTPPAEQAKPRIPPSEEGQLHYGRQHAQTAKLYQKHREERERAEQMGVAEAQTEAQTEAPVEPMGGEAPPAEMMGQEAAVEDPSPPRPDERGQEGPRSLAQQAVKSVLRAAKEAARGRPLTGARKLADDALSGVRRVAREVSARTSHSAPKGGKGGKKGPGKKR
ncbi:hypothetical protein [Archangium sp.]|uniref:hypothetical protein n=1 Tax=Archangium sp. TaxID=1872627 RepID=UPI002D489AFF|nr:hypothetical protein [Archangium sp.]HYO55955.1 hypothetical protein [Archangium sp.]